MHIDLASPTDVLGFRARANDMLAHQVLPGDIAWNADAATDCSESVRGAASRPPPFPSAFRSIVPRSFVRLTELVVLHRDELRFDLLYRLLWRLVHEPELAACENDPDMVAAQSMAHGVRRDIFKARRALALVSLPPEGEAPLLFGWCEPRHHVTEEVAEWLARTQPEDAWLLATPDRCVLWHDKRLVCGPGVPAEDARVAPATHWLALARQLRAELAAR